MKKNTITHGISDDGLSVEKTVFHHNSHQSIPERSIADMARLGREDTANRLGRALLDMLQALYPESFAAYPELHPPPVDPNSELGLLMAETLRAQMERFKQQLDQ